MKKLSQENLVQVSGGAACPKGTKLISTFQVRPFMCVLTVWGGVCHPGGNGVLVVKVCEYSDGSTTLVY